MPEPLTFKIITDADDSGIRKYQGSMDGLNVSSKKASSAINSFSRELLQAKSGADVASAGAESLAHVLHQSLAGALIVGGIKLVSDQIKGMAEAIRTTGEETASAVKQLQRMGDPSNLAEATKGADMLDQKLDAVTKRLETISGGNWFTKMLGEMTGTTEELKKQEETLTRLRDVQIAYGLAVEKQNAEQTSGLSTYAKGLEDVQEKLKERLKLADRISDAGLKQQATQDAYRLSVIDAWEFQLKMSKAVEAEQQKLNDLVEKQLTLQEQLNKAKQSETIRQGELAQMSGGAGGTSRGPGQRPTSFEIGLEKARKRAEQDQKRQEQENQDAQIAADLKAQGKAYGKQDIQREKVRRVEQGAREKVKKDFEDPYKKQIEDTTKSLKKNQEEIDKQGEKIKDLGGQADDNSESLKNLKDETDKTTKSVQELGESAGKQQAGAAAGGGIEQRLIDIYMILDNTLTELKTYAHAT